MTPDPRRFKLIACEIMFREISYCASRSRNIVDVTFMTEGLHDMGERKMSTRLQEEIDRVDIAGYEAILLGYGLCNNGIRGVHARLPLVVPRAHDCITLLMGSKEKYAAYFQANPGTYYKSPGWIEREGNSRQNADSIITQLGMSRSYEDYVAKYGEEKARYLMSVLGDWLKNYKKLAYIDTHTGDFQVYKEQTREEARRRGWEYEQIDGSLDLLQRLLDGDWDPAEFLIIPPDRTAAPTFDDGIIGLV
jgi:hypothetical protein